MKYTELAQISNRKIEQYKSLIQSYGYEDVLVKMPITRLSNGELGFRSIEAFFWFDNFGYSMEISCNLQDIEHEALYNMMITLLKFIRNPVVLKQLDIKEAFNEFLFENGFKNIEQRWAPNEAVNIYVYEDCIKYNIVFSKNDTSLDHIEDLYRECDDSLEFTESEISKYRSEIANLFRYDLDITDLDIKLTSDLEKIQIFIGRNYVEWYLEIKSPLDVTWSDKDILHDIIYCYKTSVKETDPNSFKKYLQNNFYHIHKTENSESGFLLYKENDKYAIKTSYKKMAGYDEKCINNDTLFRKVENDFDQLEGHAFETFCAKVLMQNGFEKVKVTQGSGDQGIDIIAHKDDIKYGIQCKCYSSDIGNRAVQEVFAGKTFYDCHIGVVLTNRYFTKSAIKLAQNNGVILWDRNKLLQMIDCCQNYDALFMK